MRHEAGLRKRILRRRPAGLTACSPRIYCRVFAGSVLREPEAPCGPEGGDSENAGSARQGRRVVRERHEALQEAVREGGDPQRDPQARALREAVGQAQEEGVGREEARPQEGAEGNDVAFPQPQITTLRTVSCSRGERAPPL